jgi:solute carrier family 9B (sodium/hydrogen exchanger), member 1/2
MMGGLELSFAGKGLTVVLLTVGPQFGEAFVSGTVAKFIFDLPWLLSIALGFCLGAVSPAVLVPSCMALHNENYGTKKGIPTTLIAASSFDDIAAITIFGVCITLLFEQVGGEGAEAQEKKDIGWIVGKNFIEIFSGIFYGFLVAGLLSLMNYVPARDQILLYVKLSFMLAMSVCTPLLAYVTEFPEGKYIGIIFFGYGCNVLWKTKKQMQQDKLRLNADADPKELEFDEEDDEMRKPEK